MEAGSSTGTNTKLSAFINAPSNEVNPMFPKLITSVRYSTPIQSDGLFPNCVKVPLIVTV